MSNTGQPCVGVDVGEAMVRHESLSSALACGTCPLAARLFI